MSDLVGARVVAVHAHPDDEAITTGGTIATLSERGAEVTVVTCTLGEQGEVIGAPYQGLVRSDQLGGFRIAELEAALAHLGVRHGEFLGGVARWRDSGMQGDPANDHPNASRPLGCLYPASQAEQTLEKRMGIGRLQCLQPEERQFDLLPPERRDAAQRGRETLHLRHHSKHYV